MPGWTTDKQVEEALTDLLGKTFSYYDDKKKREECNVPAGSEGSVRYFITKTRESDGISWGTVTIYGDLRDYDDHEEIYQWIKKAHDGLAHRSICARDLVVSIDVEYQSRHLISLSVGEDGFQEVIMTEQVTEKE